MAHGEGEREDERVLEYMEVAVQRTWDPKIPRGQVREGQAERGMKNKEGGRKRLRSWKGTRRRKK